MDFQKSDRCSISFGRNDVQNLSIISHSLTVYRSILVVVLKEPEGLTPRCFLRAWRLTAIGTSNDSCALSQEMPRGPVVWVFAFQSLRRASKTRKAHFGFADHGTSPSNRYKNALNTSILIHSAALVSSSSPRSSSSSSPPTFLLLQCLALTTSEPSLLSSPQPSLLPPQNLSLHPPSPPTQLTPLSSPMYTTTPVSTPKTTSRAHFHITPLLAFARCSQGPVLS